MTKPRFSAARSSFFAIASLPTSTSIEPSGAAVTVTVGGAPAGDAGLAGALPDDLPDDLAGDLLRGDFPAGVSADLPADSPADLSASRHSSARKAPKLAARSSAVAPASIVPLSRTARFSDPLAPLHGFFASVMICFLIVASLTSSATSSPPSPAPAPASPPPSPPMSAPPSARFSASFFALAAASNRSTSFLYLNPAAKYARRPPSILSTTSCALRSELSRSTSAPATASSRER